MKHLLSILILLGFISVASADDSIIGKKLYCENLEHKHHQWGGIEFYSDKRAKQYFLSVNDFKIDVLTYDIESVDAGTLIEIIEKSNIKIEIQPNPNILKY